VRLPAGGDRFVVDDFEPVYLHAGDLEERAEAARRELADCRACPRDCGVDRLEGELGVCRTGRWALVSSAFPHHGEEDCLRGRFGSGTIFFSCCNLRCVFCQNADISQSTVGQTCTAADLADLMLALQDRRCHNINLVTPEHVVPQVIEALALAIPAGLRIPLVYNTSGYDGLSSLRLMDGLVDIYMPDFKFWESSTASRLARAGDYPDVARSAVGEMHRQVGVLVTDRDGLACRGVLVRHLVMPGLGAETAAIFNWLSETLSPDTYVNVMAQYRPAYRVPGDPRYTDIDRRPLPGELAQAMTAAEEAGLWRLDARW
jgi:putative pyruvate formate lyase activating enzyme